MNSKQIQRFLNHRDHRRINSWLKELGEKEYIERDFKAIYGILTKPAVYNLSAKGRKYIKEGFSYHSPKYLKKIARDNKASKSFKIRCQVIVDLYLLWFPPEDEKNKKRSEGKGVKREEKKIKKKKENKQTGIAIVDYLSNVLANGSKNAPSIELKERQFFTFPCFPDFILLQKLKPDAYVRSRSSQGIHHTLIFVIDAYIPRFLLRYTLKRIFDTLEEEYWNEESLASLHFYFICPNNVIITYMRRMLKSTMERYYESKELAFHFATRNQLNKQKQYPEQKIAWRVVSSSDSEY